MKTDSLFTRERTITFLSFLWLFILMSGYYIIKPVRETLANELPYEALPYLFIFVMIIMFFVNIIYDFLARKYSSVPLVTGIIVFFAACLTLFAFVLRYEWPSVNIPFLGIQPGRYVWIVLYFFFVGIYNLFTVTIFWSFINEVFNPKESRKCFGKVTAGGTIGGIAGSFLTSFLVSRLKVSNLLFVSVFFLLSTLICMRLLNKYRRNNLEDETIFEVKEGESSSEKDKSTDERKSGFYLIFQSPYLRWMMAFIFLMTCGATVLSYLLNAVVKTSILDEVGRAEFWANMNLYINALALFFQLFGVHFIVKRTGIKGTILIAPVVNLISSFCLTLSPVLMFASVCHVGNYSTSYSFNRASREMLYTPTTRDFKYQSKAIIDTFVYRAGDGIMSIILIILSGWSLAAIASIGLLINILRIISSLALARHYNTLIKEKERWFS